MNHQTSRGDSTRATELFHAASRWLPLLFVASLLLLLAVRTTNSVADAQAPLVPTLERAEITEGRSLAFLISNTPSGHAAYHLRVQPIGGAFTAHPDDFTVWSIVPTDEQRDDADYIIPPGIAKTVTRDSLGKIEFEVEAHSDNAADDGEAFGLQLCSTPHCEDEAVLGDWTVSILDAILPDDRLDDGLGDGLGPAEDRFSLASMLGDDGVYVWQDGDRPIPMRLLDSLTAAEQAALDELAQPAARAYVPSSPEGGNGSSTTQPLSVTNWFRSDTGQLMLLTGGVNVIFEPHADSAVIDALFHRRGIGPERISPIGELHNGYHVATSSDAETLRLVAELLSEPIVVIADPDWFSPVTTHQSWPNTNKVARALCTKYTKWLSDELSSCLWHLNADTDYRYREVDPIIDINIDDVWETTKGEGITAMIVDARWQPRHEDLIDNVDFDRNDLGRQWVIESFTAHGTSVAGIIGARDNALGGRGVAPRASLIQHDYLGLFSNKSELESVLFQKNIVAVTNRSYGERGNGAIRQSSSWRWALDAVVREAFSGRGGLQVISAGNEFAAINNPGDGWTGLDESLTHRGVVTVAAVNSQGVSTAYSDIGPNVWVSAPSSDHTRGQPGILTTVGNNHYTASFGGTSAAAPIVTGVVALIRAANPDLTWRDVKLILAATAQKNDPTGAAQKAGAPTAWTDGAIKYGEQTARYVSNYLYGFGVVDADAAVTAAQSWTLVPDLITATASSSSALAVPGSKGEVETSLSIQSNMDFIEYVNVDVNMTTKNFRNLRVTLVSPSGEESILSPAIDSCPSGCGIDGTFQFGTARHLGEDPSGVWKLKIYNNAAQRPAEATLNSWTLTIYGHKTDMKSRRVILSVSSPTVDEGSAVTLTAKIIGAPPAQDVTIPISLEGISAEAPGTAKSDFGALTSITVKASASSGSGYITTVQDTFSEADETFRATLGNLPSGYVTPGGSPVVTILDNDPLPVVEMVVSSTSVKEGHSFAVSAKIDRVWSDNIQVCVDVMHITAVYWSRSKCVWIPAGSLVSNQFHLTVIRSPYYRPPSRTSTFQVPGFLSRGSRLAPPKPATVTVIEVDKPPVLDLSVWPTNIDEGGVVTVTAALRGSMIASPVTIPVVLTAGTATPPGSVGADYTSLSSITIPIIHNTSRSVGSRIRATNDRRQEGDETFTVAFGTLPDTVAPGRIDPITVVIKDNDAPSATIHPTADVTEGDDAAFSIHVGALPGSPSSVRVSATITQSGDFAKSTATQTITVPTGGSARLNVPTVDDGTAESDGSVTATLNPGPYYTVSSTEDAATVAVLDNDMPRLSVTAVGDITEGDDAVFTILSDPPPSSPLSVSITASQQGNFAATGALSAKTVTVPTSGSVQFSVATTDDKTREAEGSISVVLKTGQGYRLSSSRDSAKVAVSDNEWTVSITSGNNIIEGGVATFDISVSPSPSTPLTVKVTITQSGDYTTSTGSQTVTVPTTGTARVSVSTVDDRANEPDGSVTATLNAGTNYLVSTTQGAATVEVSNDDIPEVGITAAAVTLTEGEDARFTVTAGLAFSSPLTVALYVMQIGDHVMPQGLGVQHLTIPTSGSAQHIVPTLDDDVTESKGMIIVMVSSGVGYRVSTTQISAGAVVYDNDAPSTVPTPKSDPTPEISVTAGAAITEGGSASFTITADPAPQSALTVNVTVTQTGDWGATTGTSTVTIPTSGSTKHSVATTNDAVDESDGSVTVTLNTGSGYTVATNQGAATVAVSDDDDPPPSLTPEISVTAGAGVTEGGIATFTVTATPAPKAPLVVAVTVSQQGDFGAATGIKSVAIPVTGSAQYSVSTVDDAADEADGSVGLKVNTGDGYTVSASRGTAAVAVADNDVPEISVSAGGDIDEGGDATYVVTADPAPASPLSATITVTQTGDFGATTGTSNVTIPTGGSVSHSIATTDDDADEPDGSVTLTLTAGSGYTVSSTSGAATVAVADNDVASAVTPEISVTAGAGVTEGGSASFTVTANPAPSTPLAVGVTIIQSGKFAAASVVGAQTVTIPSSGSVSHSIATTDDDADEPDGSITVSVRPLSGYTVSASRPAATVSVADNDAAPSATPASCVTTDATLLAQVKSKTQDPWNGARSDLVDTFTRAYRTMQGTDTYTVAVLKARPDRQTPNWQGAGPNALWQAIYAELDRLETCRAKAQTPPPPPATPEISVTAGADVTEGDTASFTITASPAPTSALTVVVVVTRSGEYGVAVGAQTVSIPTTGSVSHTVATSGDDVVEADGSVTVAVQVGSGYSASTSQGAATVAVSDDDAQTPPPPPPPPPVETPEVRVAAGPSVTEGGSASFTITASPAPTSPLTVAIKVTQSGDYGVSTGTKTVTIPTSGTLSHAIGTVNDGADETNGSVTVTLQAGTGYNVSSSHNAATVTVSDNDVPKISVTAGADVREGGNAVFTISASPTPASPLSVKLTISQSGDFGVSTGNQTITIPTSGSVQLMIGTSNDDVDESDGSATLTLKAGAGYTISLTSSAATVGVTDDDDPPPPPPPAAKPTVTIESASASEGADELVFRVTLSEATTETVRVSWWTSTNIDRDQRSARAGLDYEQWSGTITIAAGQTSGNGAVWLLQDKLTEGPEVFDIWLAPNVRGADIAVQHAMMTIIDDD